jgi:hypothetical protein
MSDKKKEYIEGSTETLLFIQEICKQGYIVYNVEIAELDHYIVSYCKSKDLEEGNLCQN